MGRYFDFEPVKPWAGGFGDVGKALGEIGDTIVKRRHDEQELAMEKAKADAYTAQVGATNRGIAQKEMRDQVAFDQTQQDRQRQTTQAISTALGGDRYGEAEGLAASSRFQDPRHPGQMAGISFTREAPGPAPVAPEAPTEPAPTAIPDYVPVMSPEQARSKAIHDALVKRGLPVDQPPPAGDLSIDAAGAEAEGLAKGVQDDRSRFATDQNKYNADQSTYGARQAAYTGEKKTYDDRVAHPRVTLGYPGGQQVTVNPQEAELHKTEEARTMAAQLLDSASKEADPVVAATMRRQASMIAAQLPGADKGAVNNAATASTAETGRADLQGKKLVVDERIQGNHDKARVTAAALRGHGGGGITMGADDDRVVKELRGNTGDVSRKGGLQEQLDHQESTLSALRSHPENNTNWTNAVDAMIRSNTGRAAIIAQYKMYTGKAAGAEDAVAQFKEWLSTGALSPEQKKSLYGAMLDSRDETATVFNRDYDVANEYTTDPRVTSNPAVKLGVERTLHSTFRGGKRKPSTDTTVPGLPDVKLPGREPKPDATAPDDQAAIKMARDRLAKNPNDKVARQVLDLHHLAQ